jgi:hypothetical protein
MYIDPGSGSVLLQIVLAVVLGAGVLVKMFWGKIKNFFSRSKSND